MFTWSAEPRASTEKDLKKINYKKEKKIENKII